MRVLVRFCVCVCVCVRVRVRASARYRAVLPCVHTYLPFPSQVLLATCTGYYALLFGEFGLVFSGANSETLTVPAFEVAYPPQFVKQ